MAPSHRSDDEMTNQEMAQRVVDNNILTAVSRIGIPFFIGFITLIVVPVAAYYLNATAGDIKDIRDKAAAVADRVTLVEANQRNGADRGADLKAQIAQIQQAQSKFSDQQTTMLEELAGINATLKGQIGRQ